jgi:hypothetical protein
MFLFAVYTLYTTVHFFLLCWLKINYLRLFLGLLAWLRTATIALAVNTAAPIKKSVAVTTAAAVTKRQLQQEVQLLKK